jgi:hypothetical protein
LGRRFVDDQVGELKNLFLLLVELLKDIGLDPQRIFLGGVELLQY